MSDFLRWFLPIYFAVYFGLAFVVRSVLVARAIGKSPVVFPRDDTAYGLLGFYFKLTMIAMAVYVVLYAFVPAWYSFSLPISQLESPMVSYIGIGTCFISLVWTLIAQVNMSNSWRIGIDTVRKTELVTRGLFSISRNPIFVGMTLSLVGLFLTTPNAATLLFLIVGHLLIQVQIRLEEEFLANEHGDLYLDYKKKVRRMI